MLIQVTTDHHIHGSEGLKEKVGHEVSTYVSRFSEHITRIDVHLHDENAHKSGIDKRCLIEAKLAGWPSISVSHDAKSHDEAVIGASEKLERALDHHHDKHHGHKGNTGMGGEHTI